MNKAFVIILSALAFFGCKSSEKGNVVSTTTQQNISATTPNETGVFIIQEATPCFGFCPTYKLKIYHTGEASFIGQQNTPLKGAYTTTYTPEQLEQLKQKVKEANLFELNEVYNDERITDLPSTRLTIALSGKKKNIMARYGTPEKLKAFNQFMYEQAIKLKWELAE